jgi:hypothetical protein
MEKLMYFFHSYENLRKHQKSTYLRLFLRFYKSFIFFVFVYDMYFPTFMTLVRLSQDILNTFYDNLSEEIGDLRNIYQSILIYNKK